MGKLNLWNWKSLMIDEESPNCNVVVMGVGLGLYFHVVFGSGLKSEIWAVSSTV